MAKHYLGTTFDIHGGGMDLIFPHHENEMAQSCAATGQEFARTWVHNGFVQFNQEKMSKSVGNFFTIREVFEKCGQRYGWNPKVAGEVLRYFLLATHYRSPLEFSESGLVESKKALDNIYDLFLRLGEQTADSGTGDPIAEDAMSQFTLKFHQAMDDDLNTPAAIAEFQRLRAELNKSLESGLSKTVSIKAREAYRDVGRILGLFDMPARGWQFVAPQTADNLSIDMSKAAYVTKMLTDTDIELCLKDRNEARRNKDFKRADDIRHSLLQQGITIEDRPDGTSRWKR
jgi:cysteinyl-tRNA synthetase